MKNINYAWDVSAINRDDLIAFEKWYCIYEDQYKGHKIYVWGAGIRGTEFGIFISRHGNLNFVYVDNNSEKWDGHIDGIPIIAPDTAQREVRDNEGVILVATENYKEIKNQLENMGFQHNKDFFIAPNLEYENYVKEFIRNIDCEYMIMGDCLFSSISIRDKQWDNLAELIKKRLGENRCKILYMHGMGMRSYYNIFKLYCNNYSAPKYLEIMVNFDTLTGKQHLLPRSQHNQLFHMLQNNVDRLNTEFNEYVKVVDERSNNVMVEMAHSSSKLTKEQEKYMKNRSYLQINYMYELDYQTEGLVYFRKIVEYAKENGVKVIAFIPPVNYELGEKIFGRRFDEKYSDNLKIIREIVDEMNVKLIDFSHSLSKEYFAELDTADESVNENGRRYLCERLSEGMEWEK